MRRRTLLIVLGLLALATAVMWLGPYRELSSRSAPDKPFDERAVTSAPEATARFDRLGEEGRALYRQFFWTDLVFLLANGAAFTIILLSALRGAGAPRWFSPMLVPLPLTAALADLVENVAVARMLESWDAPSISWIVVARVATSTKLILVGATAAATLAALAGWSIRSVRGRRASNG
jgi:hypothetical protein